MWKYVASGFVLRDKLRRIMGCADINVYSLKKYEICGLCKSVLIESIHSKGKVILFKIAIPIFRITRAFVF